MKPIHALLALTILACIFAVPAYAQNIAPGNHYVPDVFVNKVADPPVDAIQNISQTTGLLTVHIETAGCLDMDARQIVIASYYDDTIIYAETGVDGWYDVRLPSGMKYSVDLAKGTGSSTEENTWKHETADVYIAPGSHEFVTFIGAGGACGGNIVCVPRITRAQYGALVCEQVIDQPAWTEHFGSYSWDGHDFDYVGVGHGDYNHVYIPGYCDPGHTHHGNCDPGHYHNGHWEYQYVAPVFHPTTYKEQCTGQYADVTTDVQSALLHGYMSIYFDNAANPGGLFNSFHHLVSQIVDPAPGHVKTITITFRPCTGGKETTITASEYQMINF